MAKIRRDLPNNQYQAAINANAPTALNPFATLADLPVVTGDANRLVFDVKINETGGILKGQAVYVNGADGTNILVGKADYTTEATSSKTLGLLITSGANNAQRQVVAEGILKGTGAEPLDTSAAVAGDPVWLGANGDLIYGLVNKPYAPDHLVFIGIVVEANPTVGEIFVKVQNGYELKEIHDVDLITNAPTDGQVLTYDGGSGLWKNEDLPAVIGASINPSLDPVIENTITDPSTLAPEFGDSYLVPIGATGTWLGQDNNIATSDGTDWVYYTPSVGDITTVLTGGNAGNVYQFDGLNWTLVATTSTTATPFFLSGSSVDAGGNKTANIARAGRVTLGSNSGPLYNAPLTVRASTVSENLFTRAQFCSTYNAALVNTWYRVAFISINNTRSGSYKILFSEHIRGGLDAFSAIIDIAADKAGTGNIKAKVTVISTTQGYTLTEDNFKIYKNAAPAFGPLTIGIYYRPTVVNAQSNFTLLNALTTDTQTGVRWYNTNLGATITDTIFDSTNRANVVQYGIKNNYTATVDPTVTDDFSLNYWVGSAWVNTVTDKSYICTDSTGGAAVWKQITNETPTSGASALNNVVLVNSVSDLPAPSGGTITLAANTVYEFNTGSFNIGANYLTVSDGTIIVGQSSFNTSIVYTGAGGAVRGTDVNFAARQIVFASPAGRALDFTNVAQTKNISLQNCAISSQTSASIITGYNIVFMAQTRFLNCVGGLNLVNNLGIALEFVVFNSTNSGTYITITPTATTTVKLSDCDFEINTGNTGINVTSTAISSGIIAACDFKGTAAVANRLVGVNGNTAGWNIAYGDNTGIAGIQFVDIEITSTATALGNSAGTYIDGVKGYALPIASYDQYATVMEARATALMTNALLTGVQVGVYDFTTAAIVGGLGASNVGTNVAVQSNFIAITPNREYTGYYTKNIGASTRTAIKLTLKIY